jgi:signal transduction histidine kinase
MTIQAGPQQAQSGVRLFAGALDGLLVPDDLPDGFVATDDAGVVRVFNAAAVALTGIPAERALGRAFDELLPFLDPDGRDWWACTDPYGGLSIRTGHPEALLTLPGRDGAEDRELLVTTRYVRKDGRSTPVTGLVMALRGTAARRRGRRREADLVATVAHELRSPLTSVKGFTATLLARWHRFTDDQKLMMLQTVDADADRVVRLIAELLDVARLDSGRMTLHRVPLDLHTLIADQVAACVAGGEAEDRFRIAVPVDLPEVSADPDKLRQVLANLLENAVRHGGGAVTIEAVEVPAEADPSGPARGEHAGITGNAGITGSTGNAGTTGDADGADGVRPGAAALHATARTAATAKTTSRATTVAVAVSDEGPGIPEDQRNRVFQRFWRGGRRGGTGLGLWIVKGLVEAHGGTVAVDRAPSGGARFRFTLPVA